VTCRVSTSSGEGMIGTVNAALLLGPNSVMGREFGRVAAECRCVFFSGPPGVGKSLMIQQLALIAQQRGRAVYLMRWDVARRVFETHPAGTRYPEVEGVTHPAIRWVCGLWVRGAVLRWHLDHPESAPLLIGEAPLVGNRFVELASGVTIGPRICFRRLAGSSQSRKATGNRAAASWIRSPSRGMARYPHTGQRSHGAVSRRLVASSAASPRLVLWPDRHIRYPLGRVEVTVWRGRDSRARPGFFRRKFKLSIFGVLLHPFVHHWPPFVVSSSWPQSIHV
jgi:hypothetical protein